LEILESAGRAEARERAGRRVATRRAVGTSMMGDWVTSVKGLINQARGSRSMGCQQGRSTEEQRDSKGKESLHKQEGMWMVGGETIYSSFEAL
jgi:hypothetical protein